MINKSSWDNVWDKVFTENEWGKYPSESLIQFIARNYYAKNRGEVKILEMGCGTGANIWYISREGFDVYGIDGSEVAIKKAKSRIENEGLKANLQVGDIINLPYEENFFDAVIDVECLCCNNERNTIEIVREVNRVLKPGGLFYSRTFTEKMHVGSKNTRLSAYEFTDISDGPLASKGFVRLTDKNAATKIYGEVFQINSLDKLEFTGSNGAYTVSEYILICSKKH